MNIKLLCVYPKDHAKHGYGDKSRMDAVVAWIERGGHSVEMLYADRLRDADLVIISDSRHDSMAPYILAMIADEAKTGRHIPSVVFQDYVHSLFSKPNNIGDINIFGVGSSGVDIDFITEDKLGLIGPDFDIVHPAYCYADNLEPVENRCYLSISAGDEYKKCSEMIVDILNKNGVDVVLPSSDFDHKENARRIAMSSFAITGGGQGSKEVMAVGRPQFSIPTGRIQQCYTALNKRDTKIFDLGNVPVSYIHNFFRRLGKRKPDIVADEFLLGYHDYRTGGELMVTLATEGFVSYMNKIEELLSD